MPSWLDFSMPSIDVYKPSIMQGSVLEIEAVKKLQLGMSQDCRNELNWIAEHY